MSPTVEAPRTRPGGPLKLAIPRGALWGETLDALDWIGVDTAEMRGDSIIYKKHYDIGIAVGGGKGLVVPVVKHADRLGFAELEKAA